MMTTIVDSQGWRFGYLTLAGIVATIILPVAFVMRRQPEDIGLFPDGRKEAIPAGDAESKIAVAQAQDDQQTYSRPEAIRTSGFWLLTLGYGLNAAALGSVLMYAIPFAGAAGFSRSLAATGLGINGLGNLTSKAVWGWGLQRFDPRRLAGVAFCTSATGVFTMLAGGLTQETIILMIGFYLYGFGFGGTIPISEFLWARYFGRRYIGAIRGISRPMTLFFSAGGPIATGLWFDMIGSYQGAFFTLACLYLLGAITINISKPPPPNHPRT
jgi:cyanate permease